MQQAQHQEQIKSNMDNFRDLEDEIIADDWLIPEAEITGRRLIKQTAKHNIYKADWFGEVLVYEPRRASGLRRKRGACEKIRNLDEEELSRRLGEFTLEVESRTSSSCSDEAHWPEEESLDSAYSSVSSTPRQFAKGGLAALELQFKFPVPQSELRQERGVSEERNREKCDTILNEESFKFGQPLAGASSWSELNELRLVAHESFMLFMGASLAANCSAALLGQPDEAQMSLVMQMNHPKSLSLHNLLHASKLATANAQTKANSSPINRVKQPPLSLEAKLNICQQVTDAMTYLHDKDIVHAKLTSANIYIEHNQRVKISLIDNTEQPLALPSTKNNKTCQFNLPALTYLSPEVIKSIQMTQSDNPEAQVVIDTSKLSKMSDVFSFGTLLFELFEERFPFSCEHAATSGTPVDTRPHKHFLMGGFSPLDSTLDSISRNWNGNIEADASELIYKMATGQIVRNVQRKHSNKDTHLVELIIKACWSSEPSERPQFKQFSFTY